MIVTIDGPAGTGKSTAARKLAQVLGFEFLDTGAMYRAIAVDCLQHEIALDNQAAITRASLQCRIEFLQGATLLNGEDVSTAIRTPEVTEAASIVAQIPEVRAALVLQQREIAGRANTVSEGRDQGTVVFPQAECKFFLTASPEERARRRQEELHARGQPVDFAELLRQQTERDQRDQNRTVAPLIPAADAIIVDTTELTMDEVVSRLVREVERAQG